MKDYQGRPCSPLPPAQKVTRQGPRIGSMLPQQPCHSRSFAHGAHTQLLSMRPSSCLPCNLLQRFKAPAQTSVPEQHKRSSVATAAGEGRRAPVMRELESSAAPLAGASTAAAANAPGYSGTAPGFATSQPGAVSVVQPIDQIPVSAGSRATPVVPYVPKTVSFFGAPQTLNAPTSSRPRSDTPMCIVLFY